MKRTAIIWIIYAAGILATFFLSSCSHTVINGVKVREKGAAKMDESTVFYMTVSFWLSYGISYHFFNRK